MPSVDKAANPGSTATVTAADSPIVSANEGRFGVLLVNQGATDITLGFGPAAVVSGTGPLLKAGGTLVLDGILNYRGPIRGITASGTTSIGVAEF